MDNQKLYMDPYVW